MRATSASRWSRSIRTSRARRPAQPDAVIARYRRRLDELDRRLVDLLVTRATAVRAVARAKRGRSAIIDRDREAVIIEQLRRRARARLPEAEFERLIRALRALMRRVAREAGG